MILENGKQLTKNEEGSYIRFDGFNCRLNYKPRKADCYRLHRVWGDGGISIRKYGTPGFIKPSFTPAHRLTQRVEIITLEEFRELPE